MPDNSNTVSNSFGIDNNPALDAVHAVQDAQAQAEAQQQAQVQAQQSAIVQSQQQVQQSANLAQTFTPPTRDVFERQYVQQQASTQNFDFFNKKPAQIDSIVAEAYRAEVARAQVAFDAQIQAQPIVAAPLPSPAFTAADIAPDPAAKGDPFRDVGYGHAGGDAFSWKYDAQRGTSAADGTASVSASAAAGSGPPPPDDAGDVPRYKTYKEAQVRRAEIEKSKRDLYTQQDKIGEIGKPPYNRELQNDFIEEGLAERPSFAASAREMMGSKDMAYALAFGGMQTASNFTKAAQPAISGESFLADQVQEQQATSFLPLAFSAVGTAVTLGVTKNPNAALAAQYVSGAAGQSVEDVVDTYTAGHTFAQERAGQSLGEGRGGADAVKEFTEALKNAATPAAKELAETLTKLGQTGATAPGAAQQFASFQYQMGTQFSGNVASEGRFLESSGFLAPIRSAFGTAPDTALGTNDYLGNAAAAAMTGNYDGMKASLAFAEAKAGNDVENPAYRRDKQFVDRYDHNAGVGQDIKDFFTWDGGRGQAYQEAQSRLGNQLASGNHIPGAGEPQFLSRKDQDMAASIKKQEDDIDAMRQTHEVGMANVGYGASLVGRDTGLLKTAMTRGGGAATLGAAIPELRADVATATSALDTDIAQDKANAGKYPLQKAFFLAQAADDEQKRAALGGIVPGIEKAKFDTGMEESAASYGLAHTGQEQTFTRGLLSGRTYKQLEGAEDTILSGESARASELRRDAANPILSPADRDKRLTEAAALETDTLAQRHDYGQQIYRQTLQVKDLNIGAAAVGVEQARAFGTPDQTFGAQGQEIGALRSKLAELWQEMSHGGLTADEMAGKLREFTQTGGEVSAKLAQQRDERVATRHGMAEDDLTIGTAGLGRQVRLRGSGSVDVGAVDKAYGDLIAADTFGASQYAPGTAQRKAWDAKTATDTARHLDAMDPFNVYDPGAAVRTADVRGQGTVRRAETAFNLAEMAPYLGGPASNPFTKGAGLETALKGDMGRLGSDQAKQDAERARRMKEGRWNDLAEEGYVSDTEKRSQSQDSDRLRYGQVEREKVRNMFSALPEMLEGGVSRGTYSAILPTAAMASLFSPVSDPTKGGWATPTGQTHGGTFPMNSGPLGLAMGKADDAVSALNSPGAADSASGHISSGHISSGHISDPSSVSRAVLAAHSAGVTAIARMMGYTPAMQARHEREEKRRDEMESHEGDSGYRIMASGSDGGTVAAVREQTGVLRQMLTVLSSRPGGSTLAPSDVAGGVNRQLGNSFNPNRAGG